MNLTEAEYNDFLYINQSLLVYAGKQKGILNEKLTLTDFRNSMEAKTVLECADAFYEDFKILDKFLKENPAKLDAEQLKVADKFRYFEKGTFFIYKYLSNYTAFIKDDLVYGVYALSDHFEAFYQLMSILFYFPIKIKSSIMVFLWEVVCVLVVVINVL